MRVAVGVGVHQDRAAWSSVAPGSSDLLVIRFQASRQGRVDDCADIGLVNPHAKRDRRDHYLDPACEELLLDSLAVLGIEPGVIRSCGKVTGKFAAKLRRPAFESAYRRWRACAPHRRTVRGRARPVATARPRRPQSQCCRAETRE